MIDNIIAIRVQEYNRLAFQVTMRLFLYTATKKQYLKSIYRTNYLVLNQYIFFCHALG